MARGDHWWSEPPWWAWVAMAVSLVAIIVMLPFALNRKPPEADTSVREAPEPSSSPTSTASSSPFTTAEPSASGEADAAQVLVIGDIDTRGFAADSVGWPAVLDDRLDGVDFTVATTGESGYATRQVPTDPNFAELVDAADLSDVDVVVVSGSRFDGPGIADLVNLGAGTALGAIGDGAPDARIVVIGPAWPPEGLAPVYVRTNRDDVRGVAQSAGAVFADPLAEGWFSDVPGLVGPDGVHLSAEADTYLADRIQPLVEQALAG